jgi:hypothetical protein
MDRALGRTARHALLHKVMPGVPFYRPEGFLLLDRASAVGPQRAKPKLHSKVEIRAGACDADQKEGRTPS